MKKNKIFITTLTVLLAGCLTQPALTQDTDLTYPEIEKKQDKIEYLYTQAYRIINTYPEAKIDFEYADGEVKNVTIEGIEDNRDKKQLEVYLIDIDNLEKEIANLFNRVGVYYVTETSPKPKVGYRKFYNDLQGELTYPDEAEDMGVEGIVYVKFVVDSEGEIQNIIANEDIQTDAPWVIPSLKKEAKKAVKSTSGEWEPATIGDIPVEQWVMIPVQFKLKTPLFYPPLM